MENILQISSFVAVVRHQSFGAAAHALKVEKSTLSRRVSGLEESLGFPLLKRSTRKMVLTPEGQRFFEKVEGPLHEIEVASRALELGNPQEISGPVRITAPVVLGQTQLAGPLRELMQKYPKIQFDVLLDDRVLNLTGDRIDIAIRTGPIEARGARARRLGYTIFKLYSSASYLEEHGRPAHPSELSTGSSGHRCIVYVPDRDAFPWNLVRVRGGATERHRVKLKDPTLVNTLAFAKELCRAGCGIALLPTLLVQDELLSGELTPVLDPWGAERSAYALVVPQARVISNAVKVTAEFLGKRLMESGV